MGSEMCIRDSPPSCAAGRTTAAEGERYEGMAQVKAVSPDWPHTCLLYTSDAADERSSVDLGGRRIIKKKKNDHTSDSL